MKKENDRMTLIDLVVLIGMIILLGLLPICVNDLDKKVTRLTCTHPL
jgi:hypothetical protein